MNRTTKVWFTFNYRNPSRRNPEPLQQRSGAHTHNRIGGSRTAISDHTRSQPPQRRLGSKDPRVTNSQTFNSTNSRGEHKPMHKVMARAQVLKSFTLKFQHNNKCLWGNKRGRTKETTKESNPSLPNPTKSNYCLWGEKRGRTKKKNHTGTPRTRSTKFPSLRGEIDW